MIIGITGCPGSGKSILATAMADRGWNMVDADLVGRMVVDEEPSLRARLAEQFGSDIITSDGGFDRRLVAKRAFSTPAGIRALNTIVHPPLIARIEKAIADARQKNNNLVVDCALIFEWNLDGIFDCVVCVQSEGNIRIRRIVDRDGRSPDDIAAIAAAQLAQEEKIRRADIVVTNNGPRESIEAWGMLLTHLPEYFPRGLRSSVSPY